MTRHATAARNGAAFASIEMLADDRLGPAPRVALGAHF
jgi:hypothetical protein